MLKKIAKKIAWNVRRGYRPKEFWDKWSKKFMDDPWQRKIHSQHKWLLDRITNLKPKGILEVGCGFGRNIDFLIENGIDPSSITGLDISPKMINLAKKHIRSNKINFFVSDLIDFKEKKKFDLVFTHGVLMHIPKSQIKNAIGRLVDLSKNYLVLIEQNYQADNNYTFIHDYKKLLSSRKIDIIEYRSNKDHGLDLIYAEVR